MKRSKIEAENAVGLVRQQKLCQGKNPLPETRLRGIINTVVGGFVGKEV